MINRSLVSFSSMEKTIFNAPEERPQHVPGHVCLRIEVLGTKDLLDLNQTLKHVIASVSLGYYI